MKPPAVDASGRQQLDRALHPDESWQYDPESKRALLVRDRVDPTDQTNQEALASCIHLTGAKLTKAQKRHRLLIQRALALRAQDWSVPDIARELGVESSTVVAFFREHRRAVDLATVDQELDKIAVPLATENLIHGLIAGDKDYTLETLKGRGHFRRHSDTVNRGDGTLPTLQIIVEHPVGSVGLPEPRELLGGKIVGLPRLPPRRLPDVVVSSDRGATGSGGEGSTVDSCAAEADAHDTGTLVAPQLPRPSEDR